MARPLFIAPALGLLAGALGDMTLVPGGRVPVYQAFAGSAVEQFDGRELLIG